MQLSVVHALAPRSATAAGGVVSATIAVVKVALLELAVLPAASTLSTE